MQPLHLNNPNSINFEFLNDLWFFPGGRWWLRCVLHYCWGKPYHIPHLQQILLPQHCKKTNIKKRRQRDDHLSFIYHSLFLLSLSLCVTYRTPTALVSTSPRPCLTSDHFLRRRIVEGLWTMKSRCCWKMGKSTCNRDTHARAMSLCVVLHWLKPNTVLLTGLHFHILGAGHSTPSDIKEGFYLFVFIFQSCTVFGAVKAKSCAVTWGILFLHN